MNTEGADFDPLFDDAETFNSGQIAVRVMHTPGHTPACLTCLMGQDAFVGDALFMPVLILLAVQVNARAGNLPPHEGNGVRDLKIPVNALCAPGHAVFSRPDSR